MWLEFSQLMLVTDAVNLPWMRENVRMRTSKGIDQNNLRVVHEPKQSTGCTQTDLERSGTFGRTHTQDISMDHTRQKNVQKSCRASKKVLFKNICNWQE